MRVLVQRKGDAVAEYAKSIAPRDTGRYRDSIESHVELGAGWTAIVSAHVPYARYVEFGTVDTPTFATLRKALEAKAKE